MTVNDLKTVLENPDRLRIIKDGKDLYIGFMANLPHNAAGITGQEEVKRFRAEIELRHRKWEEKHLMPPLEPELAAQYKFSDLEMKLYYTIYLI